MECVSEIDSSYDILFVLNRESGPIPSFSKQLDYIPFISVVTGVARIIFGILEMVLGILLLPLEVLRGLFTGVNHEFTLIQGAVDILRGYVAAHPFIGNIALYLFDHSSWFN
jgi:hypothetical protein